MKPKPKPGRGRKRHDSTVKPNVLDGLTSGEKLIASIQGRFESTPTAVAELLAGFVELGLRLPKSPLPNFPKLHAIFIQQASEIDLPDRIGALARDLAVALCGVESAALPNLLRKTASVIESRPLQPLRVTGPTVLAPADPTTAAAIDLLGVIGLELVKDGRRNIDGTELVEHLRTMPPGKRMEEMRKFGASGDDRSLRRKLGQFFPTLRLPEGRPRKPDK